MATFSDDEFGSNPLRQMRSREPGDDQKARTRPCRRLHQMRNRDQLLGY